jgi:hypothetical protein
LTAHQDEEKNGGFLIMRSNSKPAFFKTDTISLPVKLGTDVMRQLRFVEYLRSQVVPVLHLELQDKAQ